MQMAIDVAGFTAAEADELRQAMGSKRSVARMERLRGRFFAGMAERGITREVGEKIWEKLAAFANFGFPESHSVSFAYLVYASSWLKRYHPAAFCAALLNAQPMGFYSPHTLVQDARRHGVGIRTPDVNASAAARHPRAPGPHWRNTGRNPPLSPPVNGGRAGRWCGWGSGRCGGSGRTWPWPSPPGGPTPTPRTWPGGPGRTLAQLEALATAGAFGCFGLDRRSALWGAGAVAQGGADRLAGVVTGVEAPHLPGMEPREEALADLWATGVSPEGHPTRFVREELDRRGVVTAAA